ncbi:MAG: DNA polymerase III subunit beta [bacterium]
MNLTAKRDDLLQPLLQVGNIVERRQTLPILANVLVSVRKNHIIFTATDLEVELKTHASISSDDEGDFTVSARKLTDICKALPEDADLQLSVEGDKAVLKSGTGRFMLGTLPAVDYPNIEPATVGNKFTLKEKELKRLLDKTQFAMAHQDVRYYLNGLLLELKAGTLRAVATDGHRLALCEVPFEGEASEFQLIIPRKAVTGITRLLSDSDNEINIEVSNSHIQIFMTNGSFTSKLIDGRFPDYERVMPKGETMDVMADKETLRQALARTSILSNEKYRGIRFEMENGTLHLQAHNPEQDEANEEVQVEYQGSDLTIGFNVGYLLDILGVLDGDSVNLALIDASSSCLITAREPDGARYVVMPMRL